MMKFRVRERPAVGAVRHLPGRTAVAVGVARDIRSFPDCPYREELEAALPQKEVRELRVRKP